MCKFCVSVHGCFGKYGRSYVNFFLDRSLPDFLVFLSVVDCLFLDQQQENSPDFLSIIKKRRYCKGLTVAQLYSIYLDVSIGSVVPADLLGYFFLVFAAQLLLLVDKFLAERLHGSVFSHCTHHFHISSSQRAFV